MKILELLKLKLFYLMELLKLKKSRLELWALGVQRAEGYRQGTRSHRNKNPGNLKFAQQAGAIDKDNDGFAIFSSYESGFAALMRQLELAATGQSKTYSMDMSLREFTMKYAGLERGIELENYLANVMMRLQISQISPENKIKNIV